MLRLKEQRWIDHFNFISCITLEPKYFKIGKLNGLMMRWDRRRKGSIRYLMECVKNRFFLFFSIFILDVFFCQQQLLFEMVVYFSIFYFIFPLMYLATACHGCFLCCSNLYLQFRNEGNNVCQQFFNLENYQRRVERTARNPRLFFYTPVRTLRYTSKS